MRAAGYTRAKQAVYLRVRRETYVQSDRREKAMKGGRMHMEPASLTRPDAGTRSSSPDMSLEALVTEIGATYPLMAYTAQADEADETEAVNAAILAGLVSP
jgi:hypothetical protein